MKETAPEYPGYGKNCNGCGLCCAAEPCEIARDFAGITEAPCRAMQFEGGRFVCGMVKNPSRYMDTPDFGGQIIGGMFAKALGIGRGCDSEP
jgi:hypothetical protein